MLDFRGSIYTNNRLIHLRFMVIFDCIINVLLDLERVIFDCIINVLLDLATVIFDCIINVLLDLERVIFDPKPIGFTGFGKGII